MLPSIRTSFFSARLAISPYRVWEAGTSDMMKIPYQRRCGE
nr:MAG TPA: hypothetical protein [Bacteriophage sp.]